jgi:hypothetical protein
MKKKVEILKKVAKRVMCKTKDANVKTELKNLLESKKKDGEKPFECPQ